MTHSLSVAAMLGTATAALQQVELLYTTIDTIKSAPDFLRDLKLDIHATKYVLHNLITTCPCDSSQIISSAEVNAAVENCCRICTNFHALFTRWKKQALEEDTFWVDRWRVSLSGQERIMAFQAQLNLCRDTLAVALSTAVRITKLRHQVDTMQEIKEMMLKQNETVLQKELGRADGERALTESALVQISLSDRNWLSDESKQSRWELLQDLQQQQAFSDAFRRMCEQALTITVSERTGYNGSMQKSDHSAATIDFIDPSLDAKMLDYASFNVTPDSGNFDVSGRVEDTHHSHTSGHMCCLMLGILDTVNSDSQGGHCHPEIDLDLSSQTDNFLLEQTNYSPMINSQESSPDLSLLPQEPITPTTVLSPEPQPQPQSQPQGKEKPVCWEHGCQGRLFSSWSNLRRHQREKARQEPACYCPRCGAYFSRTSGRDQHLANMSCTRIRRYSNGRIRPNLLKIQESLDTPL
ncbi:hypothetical protein TSTA_125090 [Paecilomyces variotii No. 5]|uniref:Azaphilone pigments biosynthesis cluster protein L N-terminal domain-containing protein n=1 Tax=Byssochlamys spectabilis (strain No. 5 / NBRC 109023) TaxID=1356009 RepID=V5GC36_BYSSN|nr:hypothetical protein TSTA_125090 [Paecilomyces variotii No. 5]